MSELINRLRELSVTLGRFRSDDEVDEALNDAATRLSALEEENQRLRKALEDLVAAEDRYVADAVEAARAALEAKP